MFGYQGPTDHTHSIRAWCPRGAECPSRDTPDMFVSMGPITGMLGVADELMRHLGYEPTEHPDLRMEIEQAIGEETLDLGKAILAEHGLEVRDSVGIGGRRPPVRRHG